MSLPQFRFVLFSNFGVFCLLLVYSPDSFFIRLNYRLLGIFIFLFLWLWRRRSLRNQTQLGSNHKIICLWLGLCQMRLHYLWFVLSSFLELLDLRRFCIGLYPALLKRWMGYNRFYFRLHLRKIIELRYIGLLVPGRIEKIALAPLSDFSLQFSYCRLMFFAETPRQEVFGLIVNIHKCDWFINKNYVPR